MKGRVLLGMSGGIDSSVSAMLLQEMGYEVTGITFLFADQEEVNRANETDAETLARKLHIKHYTIDLKKEFKESVVKYFKEEYKAGRTPFPCAYCNPKIKFHYLMEFAVRENCDYISTGHYVRNKMVGGKKFIYKGVDPDKDQSFFLWGLKQEFIERLIFPLGGFYKNEIREFAKQRGFKKLAKKKDSLGICFIEGNDYRKYLEKEGIISEQGNFVDVNGKILGKHLGITNYTIGQRRGLGINLNFPVFVAKFRLDDNEIVLAKYEELYKQKIIIKNHYIADNQLHKYSKNLIVKVRYRLQETPCELNILDETRAEVRLLKPEAMIADGQTAVFYDGERLVGGGFIEYSE
jgi:tRNA-specific 2-thiouridylase